MKNLILIAITFYTFSASAQHIPTRAKEVAIDHKYRVSLPVIILPQLAEKSWDDKTHTQHIELHVKRNLDNKNVIGVKLATWRLFQPMGDSLVGWALR